MNLGLASRAAPNPHAPSPPRARHTRRHFRHLSPSQSQCPYAGDCPSLTLLSHISTTYAAAVVSLILSVGVCKKYLYFPEAFLCGNPDWHALFLLKLCLIKAQERTLKWGSMHTYAMHEVSGGRWECFELKVLHITISSIFMECWLSSMPQHCCCPMFCVCVCVCS